MQDPIDTGPSRMRAIARARLSNTGMARGKEPWASLRALISPAALSDQAGCAVC